MMSDRSPIASASAALPNATGYAGANAGAAMPAIYGAAAFAVMVWGGTAIATKIAVGALDPLLVGLLRSFVAGVALVPILLVRPVPWPRTRDGVWLLLVSAVTGFVCFPVLFAFGLRHTTASHTGLIMAAQPIFTGLVAHAVDRRWPARRWLFGCAVAMVGEVALIAFRLGLDQGGGLAGDLLILAAGLSASAGYVAGSHVSRRIGTWATTAWGNLLGGSFMIAPLLYWGRDIPWRGVDIAAWASLAYLALCASIVAYVAWYWALTKGGIARIGLLQFATPVLTVLFAVLILRERITPPLALSGLVILAGIWLAQRR